MLPQNVLYYGSETPLPERIPLRAGPLTLIYENGDLRSFRLGEREIVRRIYAAVRDHDWLTVPMTLSDVQIDARDDAFEISYTATHQQGGLDFRWRGMLSGTSEGTITFALDGRAYTTFSRNRIGFCVLHPSDLAGTPCVIEHVDGRSEIAPLPQYVVPEQPVVPFAEMRGIAHEAAPNVKAHLRFEGDIFEMEDQRNWTDASYKTFCTPLRFPHPVEVPSGTIIQQRVTLTLQGDYKQMSRTQSAAVNESPISFVVDRSATIGRLPPIGLGVASHGQSLNANEIERLRALNLGHLRVNLAPSDALVDTLGQASAEAQSLGVPLEVALLLPDAPDAALRAVRAVLEQVRPLVRRWLIYPETERFGGGAPMNELIAAARAHLASYAPNVSFAAGTNADFIFLQRNLPPLDQIDGLCYAINPQVHAFDNASLAETLAAQTFGVATAKHIAPQHEIIVSPITLKMPFNAYASAPPLPLAPGELPPQVDVRQMSLFGAGWTLGSIKYLAESGVDSLTYYETTGWRGVMELAEGAPEPQLFRSLPGAVFPLYHVLAGVGAFAGGDVLAVRSSEPLRVDGLALRNEQQTRVFLANLGPTSQQVAIRGLAEQVHVTTLDETNVINALQLPKQFRAQTGAVERTVDGALTLTLRPYAVAQITCNSSKPISGRRRA